MRKLTTREQVLLVCLAVVAVVSGYILLFHLPITQQMESLQNQIVQSEELNTQLQNKLTQQWQMKTTLEQLSEQENQPHYMPAYDNLQAVMVELNSILTASQEYSLTFQTEQGEDNILRRNVTIPFACGSYAQTHEILRRLHDGPLRNFLSDLQMTQDQNGTIKTTVVLTFFEYQKSTHS